MSQNYPDPTPEYFRDNYGQCRRDPCLCLDPDKPRFGGAWVGALCPDWQPLGVKSFEELLRLAKERRT